MAVIVLPITEVVLVTNSFKQTVGFLVVIVCMLLTAFTCCAATPYDTESVQVQSTAAAADPAARPVTASTAKSGEMNVEATISVSQYFTLLSTFVTQENFVPALAVLRSMFRDHFQDRSTDFGDLNTIDMNEARVKFSNMLANEVKFGTNQLEKKILSASTPSELISTIKWTKRWLELLKKSGDWRHGMIIARAEAMLAAGQALLGNTPIPAAPVSDLVTSSQNVGSSAQNAAVQPSDTPNTFRPELTTSSGNTPPTSSSDGSSDASGAEPSGSADLKNEITYGLAKARQRFEQRESVFKILETLRWTETRIRDFETAASTDQSRSQAESARAELTVMKDRAAQMLISDITYGLAKFDERKRAGESAANLRNTVSWTELRLRELKRLDDPASRVFAADAERRLQQARAQIPAAVPAVPYLRQLDNALNRYGTCQNTSIAMTLRAYGWTGTPDDLTREFGNGLGKEPNGVAEIINTIAARAGLKIRAVPHTQSTPTEFREAIARGPVITHGWFTKDGHVVVATGYDGNRYQVQDPAGAWNQQVSGSYDYNASGANRWYSKAAFESAVVEGGTVWYTEIVPLP